MPPAALRSIDLPGGRVHYRESGPTDGPPVVFVHGFLVDHTLWSDVPELLGEQGFRTLAPTWRWAPTPRRWSPAPSSLRAASPTSC